MSPTFRDTTYITTNLGPRRTLPVEIAKAAAKEATPPVWMVCRKVAKEWEFRLEISNRFRLFLVPSFFQTGGD